MRNIKVRFSDNMGEGETFDCIFRTYNVLESFLANWQNYPGYTLFNEDVYSCDCTERLPVIPNNWHGFITVMRGLNLRVTE